jgi:hypothetical protein
MKWIAIILSATLLVACGDSKKEEADKDRQKKLENMYRTPPPSDRSKDKGV